jgi:hypothetical protein
MRTAREIYEEYKIMPNLQLHQLRVAAVGKLVCGSLTMPINTHDVLLACLFHDMGNIIKSDLTTFPDLIRPEEVEKWTRVKEDFIRRYGKRSHEANVAIAGELGLPDSVGKIIDSVSFSKMRENVAGSLYEIKIVEYADSRAGPYGILPLQERLEEARKRYLAHKDPKEYYSEKGFRELEQHAFELEKQIFSRCSIKPEDINDAAVAPIIEQLWGYPVE